jgi:hypothetical protein
MCIKVNKDTPSQTVYGSTQKLGEVVLVYNPGTLEAEAELEVSLDYVVGPCLSNENSEKDVTSIFKEPTMTNWYKKELLKII